MKPKDWTLLVISVADSRGLSPVQLQKSLFLLERRLAENIPEEKLGETFYEFVPYNYGPFDVKVYQDADVLEERGLVTIQSSAERRWKLYQATQDGLRVAMKLRSEVSPRVLSYLDTIVTWVLERSFRDLVLAVYKAYPEFREHSVFQG
jgi:uncharacterized protein